MKIALASDLHMEHVAGINPEFFDVQSDVLVLAGDICEVRRVADHYDFFRRCSDTFAHVIVVMGNHEHYGSIYDDTLEEYRTYLSQFPNVHVLEKDCKVINGYRFIGTTLWGGMHGGDPLTLFHVNQALNDHRKIRRRTGKHYHKFTAEQAFMEHRTARDWLVTSLETLTDLPAVVVTHHTPTVMSITPRYRAQRDHHVNGAYHCNLEMIMRPGLLAWLHGHVHDEVDYMVESTRVLGHPRGLPGHHGTSPVYQPLVITLDNTTASV